MAEIKPEDTTYVIPENLQYDPIIRKLKVSDPAHAETVFNPLFQQIINNIHAVKVSDDTKAKENLSNVLDSVFLEKVKAVGGSGSNLDADTVDGKHASDFAPAGFGLGTSCINLPNGTDLNNLPEKYKFATGFYMIASPVNKPEEIGGGWVYLIQLTHYETHILQLCFELNATKEAGNIFIRQFMSAVWTPWKKPDADTVGGKALDYLLNYANLTNTPKSLPANGGNADTVDGKHATELQDYNNLTGKLVFNNQIGVDEEEFNKYNGADFRGCNIDIRTWHGVGIRSTCNNPEETSSIVFDAREGTIKTIGEIYAATDKKVWHEGNDGSGSGLDADTIDGKHATDLQNYLNLSNSPLVFYSDVGGADFDACNVDLKLWDGLGIRSTFANPEQKRSIVISSRDGLIKTIGQIYAQTDKKVWHEGNDGSGSGLDADTVDGKHAGVLYSNCSATVPTSYLGDNVQYQVY